MRFFRRYSSRSDDFVIALLRLGVRRLNDGVTPSEVKAELVEQGHEFEDRQLENAFVEAFDALDNPQPASAKRVVWTGHYVLKIESYFNLLEHDELQEARASSRKATRWAIVAISISAVLALASILYQIYGSEPIKLDSGQFERFIDEINSSE